MSDAFESGINTLAVQRAEAFESQPRRGGNMSSLLARSFADRARTTS
jgi:hypothetical protein